MSPYNPRLQGDAAVAKATLLFNDLPVLANALSIECSRFIANARTVSGPMNSTFPFTMTVMWKIQIK
jgi:hypothetical protein